MISSQTTSEFIFLPSLHKTKFSPAASASHYRRNASSLSHTQFT